MHTVQAAIAQTRVLLNRSSKYSSCLSTASISSIMGGHGGSRRGSESRRFAIPRRERSIRSCLWSVSGASQPCARCHARTAGRYLRTVVCETGSNSVCLKLLRTGS